MVRPMNHEYFKIYFRRTTRPGSLFSVTEILPQRHFPLGILLGVEIGIEGDR